MSPALAVCLVLNFAPAADAKPLMGGPAEAKTTAEIVVVAEKEDVKGGLRKDAPHVSTAEFRDRDAKAFAAWFNPCSGEAAVHFYLYVFNEKKGVWVRKVATVFRDTHLVSVEFGSTIAVRDFKGNVIHRYPEK